MPFDSHQLELTRPVWLAALAVLPVLVYYFYRSLVDLPPRQMLVSLLVRIIVILLLVLSLAPPLKKIEWSERRLQGCRRFLGRVRALGIRLAAKRPSAVAAPETAAERALEDRTHEVIRVVTRDLERLRPNKCITALIQFLYTLTRAENEPCADGSTRLGELLLSPTLPPLPLLKNTIWLVIHGPPSLPCQPHGSNPQVVFSTEESMLSVEEQTLMAIRP